ncbi:ATP-binding protein [Flavobacterium hiemivividum]|uniref:histidine kinase n=1 Tax=Flavobacterium hiemivividum TaxID=2541734 RepID=A0A4R5CZN1_9FLAO|nr:ATP-binding protein [Flavobacterium hiemivividum]TDE04124.1 response regulator [Flavobacterium hiemivividum]
MKNKFVEFNANGLTYKLVCFFFLGLLSVVVFLSYLMYTNFNAITKKQENRHESYLVADLLRQSSDDLTRFSRLYIITEDERYEKMFWEVLNIQNGNLPFPENYNRVYWDVVMTQNKTGDANLKTQSLAAKIRDLGFTTEELVKLKEAKLNSDNLVLTEERAMNAVKGLYKDAAGDYTIIAKPNKELATELVFGQQFHKEKAEIAGPINDFFEMIDVRTKKDIEVAVNREKFILVLIFVFVTITMLVLFYILIVLMKKTFANKALIEKYNKRLRKDNELLEKNKKELSKATDIAELANKAKSDFLANMSHEIRTPMNGILGFIEILSEIETDAEKKEYLDIINTASNNLLNIINDILHLSKIESGSYSIQKDVVDLYNVVKKSSRLFEEQAKAKQVKFVFEFDNNLKKHVLLCENSILHILNNVLSNAVKFTHNGFVKLSVKELEGGILELVVEDTGIGICEIKQKNLYNPFDQGEHFLTKKYGGTGLGLPIVKKLVDLMGGEVHYKSAVGEGTTVSILLPFEDTSVPKIDEIIKAENIEVERNLRIVSADDVEINQKVLEKMLRGQFLEFKKVYNGNELIAELQKNHCDIVFMDIQMPELNGIDTTKWIRNNSKLSSIVIIGVSAFALGDDSQKAIDAGMDDYITKPYNRRVLVNIINKWGFKIFAAN